MALKVQKFDRYELHYYAGQDYLVGESASADIQCMDDDNFVGAIFFFPEGLVGPCLVTPEGYLLLSYDIGRFNDVITTLRTEKPLYLIVYEETGDGLIATGTERIAELRPKGKKKK
jgi:hypothetical protein